MRKTIVVFILACVGVMAAAPSRAALLENPGEGRLYSGIGVISGWKCDAEGDLTVRFNGGEPIPLAYRNERRDTQVVCGDTNNGFVAIMNWGLLGDGEHVAAAYDNGVEFSRSTFTVGSTGEEFLRGARRRHLLENFPVLGETVVLEWNESSQHFEIRGMLDRPMGGVYDLLYWRSVSRDLIEGTYQTAAFLYAEEPALDTCRAGALTPAAQARALEAMNQIRALHGVAPVRWSTLYSQQAQEAALIGKANGGIPSHFPATDAKCYTQMGAAGAGSSNLVGGDLGARDPVEHMVVWANDFNNADVIAEAGHRRWLLNPFSSFVSYGQVGGAAAQKVFGFEGEEPITPQIAVDYVAFPYETYPFHLVEGDPPWSFSIIEDKRNIWGNRHPYFENARISVVRTSDDASLVVTDRYTDATNGFGVPNFLSWRVEGWEYDTLYEVEIRDVTLRNGVIRSYSYPVFIDRANIEY